jgi:hypothetical protein
MGEPEERIPDNFVITSDFSLRAIRSDTSAMPLSPAAAMTTGVWRDDSAIPRDNDRRTT